MLNLKVKEKNKKSQEKRYIVSLSFNWTGKAKSKDDAETKARDEFIKRLKNIDSMYMQPHIEEIHEVNRT